MKNFFKYAMMLVAVVMSAVVISSCSKDDDDNNGGSNSTGIYGTWKTTLYDGTTIEAYCTVVITQNSMSMTWDDVLNPSKSEQELYDSFEYDSETGKITAHRYKNGDYDATTGKWVYTDADKVKNYYVKWIDNNHIQIGKSADKMSEDFGTLVRQ